MLRLLSTEASIRSGVSIARPVRIELPLPLEMEVVEPEVQPGTVSLGEVASELK